MDLVGDVDDGLNESLVPLANGTCELRTGSIVALEDLGAGHLVEEASWCT